MILTVTLSALILIYSAWVVFGLVKKSRMAKRQGVPAACACCSFLNSSSCGHGCNGAEQDKKTAAANDALMEKQAAEKAELQE